MSAALLRVVRVALSSLVLALAGCRSLSTPVETPEYLRAKAEILSATASPEHELTVHSHNDFEQEHPLLDALRFGYRSAEVDVIDRSDACASRTSGSSPRAA